MKKPEQEHTINENIPFPKVFLIGAEGEKMGVYNTQEAIQIAKDQKMDLVLIAIDPKPIARILNYGKFKYERKKKQKAAKEKQTTIQNRQIRLTPLIGDHDIQTKARKAREFLLDGDRIKVSLKFRGREITKPELGYKALEKFFAQIEDIAEKTKEPEIVNERFLDMFLQPNKVKVARYKKEHNLEDKQTTNSQDDAVENSTEGAENA
ncbi:translation initiation factor IF-3 [Mycoplasmopsis felifaucium]|uniref:Translation initiation factor IF-3 n=1 Tax=Mycoplasmopsis felifaucium TaxID=35768 RepID=A0ABZ2RRG0_9BACT|nr:translation initiation factor IF-3 [Mycoplasmopsis felifaucium]